MMKYILQHFYARRTTSCVWVFLASALTSSCVGTQAARDLTVIELSHMSEYGQLIEKKIAQEEAYYSSARNELVTNLQDALKNDVAKNILDRRAIIITDQWQNSPKKAVSENDLLQVLDGISLEFHEAQTKTMKYETTISEQYLEALEKLEYQQKKLKEAQTSLRKLNSELSLGEKAAFSSEYIQGVVKAVEELNRKAKETTANETGETN